MKRAYALLVLFAWIGLNTNSFAQESIQSIASEKALKERVMGQLKSQIERHKKMSPGEIRKDLQSQIDTSLKTIAESPRLTNEQKAQLERVIKSDLARVTDKLETEKDKAVLIQIELMRLQQIQSSKNYLFAFTLGLAKGNSPDSYKVLTAPIAIVLDVAFIIPELILSIASGF